MLKVVNMDLLIYTESKENIEYEIKYFIKKIGELVFVSPLPNIRICDRMFGINFFSCPEFVKSRVQEIVIEYREIGMILHDVRNTVFLVYLI